ncbi:hypothetical protein JYG34_15960 [Pseudomonas entomophila]|uniref:hypothetical protein n=1 Tax=Pseudomonas entomophila TaxID=312306 RepID=UPI001BD0328A|nr:hypothetical protein [Pseudomonas entomophila]QVM89520.1 hypothetical protein JYG34_15960 [Pseudomonas entomophila]
MSSFWSTGWAMVFMAIPFLLCQIGLIMSLMLTRESCYDRVVKALPRSAWVEQRRRSFDELSFRSRWYFINTVSGAFLYPSYVIRKGLVDESEVVAFPAGLRCMMVVSAWFSIIGFLWLIFAVALLAFTRAG